MIKVNLLPPEYRKVERTPVLRFLTILGGVVLSASAIGAFLYVHFGMLVNVVGEREKLDQTCQALQREEARSLDLLREAAEYKKRRETIEEIGRNRIVWSRKLDELCDIIHNKGDTKRHLVWLKQIRTTTGKAKGNGGLYISGFSGGAEVHRLSDFHLDLKNSDFFDDFQAIDNPEGDVTHLNDDRVPKTAWTFDFNMELKPFGWREETR